MKRFHVHLSVPDLPQSIAFYSRLFGAEPTLRKDDYAKWMIDEPRVNFAISARGGGRTGLNHLGLQADDEAELEAIRTQFDRADAGRVAAETNVSCCYARSNKHWVTDPQGIAWEAFHTLESVPTFDSGPVPGAEACCSDATPKAVTKAAAGCWAPAVGADAPRSTAACC
jgi:catechol 2,3-dioxygenase-like lactoylglutathione lyase family enzyme